MTVVGQDKFLAPMNTMPFFTHNFAISEPLNAQPSTDSIAL